MLVIKQKIIDKINENQEEDVKPFTWLTISYKLKKFWINYFREEQKIVDLLMKN